MHCFVVVICWLKRSIVIHGDKREILVLRPKNNFVTNKIKFTTKKQFDNYYLQRKNDCGFQSIKMCIKTITGNFEKPDPMGNPICLNHQLFHFFLNSLKFEFLLLQLGKITYICEITTAFEPAKSFYNNVKLASILK